MGLRKKRSAGRPFWCSRNSPESLTAGLIRLVEMSQAERELILRRAVHRGSVLTYERYIAGWDKVLANNSSFPGTDGWASSDPEEAAGFDLRPQ